VPHHRCNEKITCLQPSQPSFRPRVRLPSHPPVSTTAAGSEMREIFRKVAAATGGRRITENRRPLVGISAPWLRAPQASCLLLSAGRISPRDLRIRVSLLQGLHMCVPPCVPPFCRGRQIATARAGPEPTRVAFRPRRARADEGTRARPRDRSERGSARKPSRRSPGFRGATGKKG
jgi:hypothetical protein